MGYVVKHSVTLTNVKVYLEFEDLSSGLHKNVKYKTVDRGMSLVPSVSYPQTTH